MIGLCETGCFMYCFFYARFCTLMEEITGFSMEDSLSAPKLGWKYFNSSRKEEDEPVYTYDDEYMRYLKRQSKKGEVSVLLISISHQKIVMIS